MEKIDLATVIQETVTNFSQNRIGEKPPVFVMISAALPHVPWQNRAPKEFVRLFLYESLLTSDPDTAIEVSLRRRSEFKDLNDFLGVHPSYWVQLRVSGRGLRVTERLIEDLFADIGYRCEEWVGVEGSSVRLGIFGAIDTPMAKMIFCLESSRDILKCDLLLPVSDTSQLPRLTTDPRMHEVSRT